MRWRLRATGVTVYVVLAEPHSGVLPANMVARHPFALTSITDLDRVAFDRSYAAIDADVRAAAVRAGARLIDPRDLLCTPLVCRTTQDGVRPVFKDESHLRASYIRMRSTPFDALIVNQ